MKNLKLKSVFVVQEHQHLCFQAQFEPMRGRIIWCFLPNLPETFLTAFNKTFALMLNLWFGLAKPGAFRHLTYTEHQCYAEGFAYILWRHHSPFFRWDYIIFRNSFLILILSSFSANDSFSFWFSCNRFFISLLFMLNLSARAGSPPEANRLRQFWRVG